MHKRNKKGVNNESTPRGQASNKNTSNYSRLTNLCIALSYMGIAIAIIAHIKNMDSIMFFSIGMAFSAMLFNLALTDLEEEEDEDDD